MRTAICSKANIIFNFVVLTYLEIKKFMKSEFSEPTGIQILKRRFTKYLNEKFPIHEHHIIETYLSPEYRSVRKDHRDSKFFKNGMKLLNASLEEPPESDSEREKDVVAPIQSYPNTLFTTYRESLLLL